MFYPIYYIPLYTPLVKVAKDANGFSNIGNRKQSEKHSYNHRNGDVLALLIDHALRPSIFDYPLLSRHG
ncbi:MAG: hypothetical protein KR126chlam6_00913 [Candidatus Anoxychlamydiales bacterium]|nr:hypothetical protein [Candidatus Anoxychlamydiales bacterium]